MFYKIDITTRRIVRVALIATLAAATQPALAESPQDRNQAVRDVTTQDLNLASPSGQRMLEHRLKVAARQLCHEVVAGEPTEGSAFDACYSDALADAEKPAATMIAQAQRAPTIQVGLNQAP